MDKLISTIEYLAPVLLAYPKWAQGLFILTTALLSLSVVVFLILLPSAKQGTGSETQNPISSFNITNPQSGDFITARRFSIEGTGANSAETNALKVQLINVKTDASASVQGHLTVNSDTSWRFDYVEFQDPGPHDLVIDAIFGKKKYSKKLRINYESDVSNINPDTIIDESIDENKNIVVFITKDRQKPIKLLRSIRQSDAIIYDSDLNELIFKHWGYLWSRDKVIDFSVNSSYEISFDFKAAIVYPEYFDQYPPELHFFLADGSRNIPRTGNVDDISLLGKRIHIIFPVDNSPISIYSTKLVLDSKTDKPGKDILKAEKWHKIILFIEKNRIKVYIDDKNIISTLNINLSGRYYLRFENWASTANYILRNMKIKGENKS